MSYIKFTPKGKVFHYNNQGELHRVDGPATIRKDFCSWFQHNQLHREDGPAIEFNGLECFNQYYYRGHRVDCRDDQTFQRLLRLKAFW